MDALNTLETKLDFARRGITIRCAHAASRLPPAHLQRCLQDSRIPVRQRRIIVACSPNEPSHHKRRNRSFPFSFFYFLLSLLTLSAFICGGVASSRPQQFRPADKRAPPLVKPQQPLRLLRDPNPYANPDPPHRPHRRARPQHIVPTQI